MDLVIEDFVAYRRSVLWRIHDLYYTRRGVAAFEDGEIPSRTTTNAAIGRQYAELVLAAGHARDGELTIVEIGSGSGELAANVMTALELDCGDAGRRLYERTRYALSDFRATVVEAAAANPYVRAHVERGRIVPALFDLRDPTPPHTLDGRALAPAALAIANYIACVSPTTYVRRNATGTSELAVQLRVVAPDDPSRVPANPDALVVAYRADPAFSIKDYDRRYEWRPLTEPGLLDDPLHARVLARLLDGGDTTLTYPYGFLELLERMASWLAPDGLVLATDYGSGQRAARPGTLEPRPVFYGDSLNHAVQFATLDAFALETSWDLVRTEAPLRSVEHCLFARGKVAPALAATFAKIFVDRHDGGDLLDHLAAARLHAKAKEYPRAARHYARALTLDPRSAELHYEMGQTCIEAGQPALAIDHLERCAALDLAGAFDHDFQLGMAAYAQGRFAAAIAYYDRSNLRELHHVTWWNLALCHRALGDLGSTCRALDRALALEPTYDPARRMAEEIRGEWWRSQLG